MTDRSSWRNTDDAPFVEAVIAAPEEDAPRLVYADVLSERGDERGELVVLQCALAKLPPDDARRPGLEARHAELLANVGSRTAAVQAFLHRGFALKALLVEGGAKQLVEQTLFATILELVIWRTPSSALAQLIEEIAAPDLPLLRSLFFSKEIGGRAGAALLGTWPVLAQLTALAFLGNDLGLAGLDALLRSRYAPPLEALIVQNDALRGLGPLLAKTKLSPTLSVVEVAACKISTDDVAALVQTQPRLSKLRLDLNEVGDDGALAIASGKAPLVSLSLSHTGLTARGAVALASAPALQLEELSIESCEWTGDGAIVPVVARFARLATLRAGSFSLEGDAIEALVRAVGPAIRVLDLRSSSFGPRGAEAIAGAERLRGLRELSLAHVQIGDAGATALAEAHFAKLEHLDLTGCGITDAGAAAFARSSLPRALKIDLNLNVLSEAVRRSLSERFPGVTF